MTNQTNNLKLKIRELNRFRKTRKETEKKCQQHFYLIQRSHQLRSKGKENKI